MHLSGAGVIESADEAVKWFSVAADHGDALAKLLMGDAQVAAYDRRRELLWKKGIMSIEWFRAWFWKVNAPDTKDFATVAFKDTEELNHGDAVVGHFSILGSQNEHWALYDKHNDVFIELSRAGEKKQVKLSYHNCMHDYNLNI